MAPDPALLNRYWLLRHGRSKANEAGMVVSSLANGVKEEWTLSAAGTLQAEQAGQVLREQLLAQLGCVSTEGTAAESSLPKIHVYSSPFSRTMLTAQLAVQSAGYLTDETPVQVAEELRERYFGSHLELQPYDKAYGTVWENDINDSSFKPGGDGESVADVSARIQQLFQRLEQQHTGANVLLVAHGDTLSILQATMVGDDVRNHRKYAFETAELRRLQDIPSQ